MIKRNVRPIFQDRKKLENLLQYKCKMFANNSSEIEYIIFIRFVP